MTKLSHKKIILFDIDGTLLISGGAGTEAFNKTFHDVFQIENAYHGTVPHGKTDPIIIQEIAQRCLGRDLNQDEYREISARYLKHFAHEVVIATRFQVLQGVHQLFDVLRRHTELILGIQSGNFEKSARLKLERGNLSQHFSCGGFGSDSKKRSEIVEIALKRASEQASLGEVDRERVYVIGDAVQDVLAGKQLGVRTVGVATGKDDRQTLSSLSPDLVLDDLSDAKTLLDFIFG